MAGELWAGPANEPDRYTLWSVVGGGGEGKVYRALSRDWSRFTATVGISDDSPAQSAATFKVFLDGKQVAGGDLVLGRPPQLDLDVSQKLRLRLEMLNTTCGRLYAQRS